MSYDPNARNFRGASSPMISAAIRREYRDVFPELLRRDGRSAKELSRGAECSPRQIDNIRQGESGTSVPTFILLARQIPELRAMVLRWLEAERDLDPAVDRLSNDIMRLVEQFEAARGRKAFNGGGERG